MIAFDSFSKESKEFKVNDKKYVDLIFIYFSILIYCTFIFYNIENAFQGNKEEFGRSHSLVALAIPFSLAICIGLKRYYHTIIIVLIIIFETYIGNREALVFSAISVLVVMLWVKGNIRLIVYYKYIIFGILSIFVAIMYKNVSAAIISGDWQLAIDRLGSIEYYIETISKSEPFITQSILNYAIVLDWTYDGPFFKPIFASLIPFGDIVVGEVVTISRYINDFLFEDVGYGVASNVWAESYIYGGWFQLIIYAIIYSMIPAMLNFFMNRARYYHQCVLISIIGTISLFYMHRSGLDSAINMIKRLLFFYFLCTSLSLLLDAAVASMKESGRYGRMPRHNRVG